MWQYNASQNRFTRLLPDGRSFEIESAGRAGWDLWYRRPPHPLCIGRFRTVDEAKAMAEDVENQLARNREMHDDG